MRRTQRMPMTLVGVLLLAAWAMSPGRAAGIWEITVIDGEDSVGWYNSVAILPSGHPAVSYLDATHFDLKYAWFDGTSWQATTVDSDGDVGRFTSLAILPSGDPAISYYDDTNDLLKYASHDGTVWHTQTVASMGYPTQNATTSLAVLPSGNPAISYYDGDSADLLYAWFDGSTWQTTTVDSDGDVGQFSSLGILPSGQPAIAYYQNSPSDDRGIYYAWFDGTDWHTSRVDGAGEQSPVSLAVLPSGQPAIAYVGVMGSRPTYAWFDGTMWQTTIVVDEPAVSQEYGISLAILTTGQPAVVYGMHQPYSMEYAWYDGSGWRTLRVDGVGYPHCSLAILPSGEPAISYHPYYGSYDLQYATMWPAAPVPMNIGYTATAWTEWAGSDVTQNGWAYSYAEGPADLVPGYVSSSVGVHDPMPGGHLCGGIMLSAQDPVYCWEWWEEECIFEEPSSTGNASGTIDGTLDIGTSDEHPPGSALELRVEVEVLGSPGDAEDYYLQLLRGADVIGQIDPNAPEAVVVAVEAGETLTLALYGAEEDWHADYEAYNREFGHWLILGAHPCPGDLDGDGDTDHSDLGILLADWGCVGSGPEDCPGDADGDFDTDHSDLGILLADWGCGT